MKSQVIKSIILLSTFMVVACGSNPGKPSNPGRSSQTEPMAFEGRENSKINLLDLIDPENRRYSLPGRSCSPVEIMPRDVDKRRKIYADDLTCALEAFQTYYMSFPQYQSFKRQFSDTNNQNDLHYKNAVNSLALAIRRNQIQDRIILRSDSMCSDFQRRLNLQLRVENDTSFVNWVYNSRTRLIGGAGSLFLNNDAIFALTSAARITGLPGYVNDEDQLEVAVIQIAVEGIKLARMEHMRLMNDRRFFLKKESEPLTAPYIQQETFKPLLKQTSMNAEEKREIQKTVGVVSIGTYTLERALADVIEYHGTCSISAGLKAATHTLQELNRE